MSITNNNLFTDDKGGLWLKYQRRKNGRLARVKLLPEAILLIGKYKDESRDTLFPMQRYDVLRANMKGLRIMADLTQDLYYHVARHCFGTIVLLLFNLLITSQFKAINA